MENEAKEGTNGPEDIVSVAGAKLLENLLPAMESHARTQEKNAESMERIATAFERIARVAEMCESHFRHTVEHQPWNSVR